MTGLIAGHFSMGLLLILKNLGPGPGHSSLVQGDVNLANWLRQELDLVSQIQSEEKCWYSELGRPASRLPTAQAGSL